MSESFKVISPAPHDVWETVLNKLPQNMIFVTPKWIDAINEVEGTHDASRFYEFSSGNQVLLPLVRSGSWYNPFSRLASLPHGWGMGGLLAPDGMNEREFRSILEDLKNLGFFRISIRPNPLDERSWINIGDFSVYSIEHATHILDISRGFEHYWSNVLDSATRNKIRKGEKSRLTIECDQTGRTVDDFYTIYLNWTDARAADRHLPRRVLHYIAERREPLKKFQAVSSRLQGNCQIWTVRKDGQPIASAILLIHNVHAYYWRSYSDRALVSPTRANELLQKHMIEEACRLGCRYYHMGESGGVPSLIHFKEKFGAVAYNYREYYLERVPVSRLLQLFDRFLHRIENRQIMMTESGYGH